MSFLEQLVNGLVLGHAYALIAIGWTVLLGVAHLVNFAHGQMYMVGAFVSWYILARAGLPYPVAILCAMAAGAVIGLIMQRVMLKLTIKQDLVSVMIVTLGFGHMLDGAAALIFGSTGQVVDTPLSMQDIYLGDIWLTWQDIAIVITAILFFILVKYVISNTSVGRWVRMVAEDPKLADLAGVDIRRIYMMVFAFEGVAITLAAAMVSPRTPILTSMGFNEVIITFVVVVLGGIGSIWGSYLAGLGIGLFIAFFGAWISAAYSTAAMFVVLILVLVLRPGGLAASQGGH